MQFTNKADMPINNNHDYMCPKRVFFIVGSCDGCRMIERVRKDERQNIIDIMLDLPNQERMVQLAGWIKEFVKNLDTDTEDPTLIWNILRDNNE